jgi:hypothetical protein
MNASRNYGLLRTIAQVLKILAWVALAAGVIGFIIALSTAGRAGNELVRALASAGAVAAPVLGVVWFVQLYGFGSVLSLLMDIEQHTSALAARPPTPPAR